MNDKEMTICQCCEAISELTHDEAINEILNYIEEKATHMNNKLIERKEQIDQFERNQFILEYCLEMKEQLNETLRKKNDELKKALEDSISLEESQAMQFTIDSERIHNTRLEKALDKACLYLANIHNRSSYFERKYYEAIGQEVDEEEQDWNSQEGEKV